MDAAQARGDPHRAEEVAKQLRSVDPTAIGGDGPRIAFWLNLYNARLLHALALRPRSGHLFRHRRLFRTGSYEVGGHSYTLDLIEHGLLRGNARPPYSPRRLLREGDPRLAAAPAMVDPRIHFALNCGARSCPPIRPYSGESLDAELEAAARAYVAAESRLDRARGELELPGLVKLYRDDFGAREQLLALAADGLGRDDADWIRAHQDQLTVRFARFDWRLVT